MTTIEGSAKPKRKGGVAAALAGGGLGKVAPVTPTQELTEEEKERLAGEQRELHRREERERQERAERGREERKRQERAEREHLAAAESLSSAPATEQRRRPGRPKTLEGARRGRSFRASDPEYQAVYDTLDALFAKVPPSIARRIEPSAIVRAALRIGKKNPDLVLKEIQEHNDFT